MSRYYRRPCIICGEAISTAGAAATSHARTHIRDGRMVRIAPSLAERGTPNGERFLPINQARRSVTRHGWVVTEGTLPPEGDTQDTQAIQEG